MKEQNKKIIIASVILVVIVIVAVLALVLSNKETKQYSVTFDTNGGSLIDTILVNENGTVIKPENPVKEGYEFVGWYYNNEAYDFNSKVTADIKLEAVWTKIQEKPNDNKEETVKVTGVSLNKAELTLTEGESSKLTATVKPSNATTKNVTWKSSNTSVVTVDSKGNVKALKAGTATITVTTKDGNYKATCKVTVKAKEIVKVTGVSLNKTTLTLTEGQSSKLTATVTPNNATNKDVIWSSSNKSVATVDSKGNVKALKAGTATITVTTKDGNYKASCEVTVKEKPASYSVIITPEAQDVGGVLRYKLSVTKNNSSFTGYQRIICGGIKLGSTVSLSQYEKIKNATSATIKLTDGTDVTATVNFKK